MSIDIRNESDVDDHQTQVPLMLEPAGDRFETLVKLPEVVLVLSRLVCRLCVVFLVLGRAYLMDDRVEAVLVVGLVFHDAFRPVRFDKRVCPWKYLSWS